MFPTSAFFVSLAKAGHRGFTAKIRALANPLPGPMKAIPKRLHKPRVQFFYPLRTGGCIMKKSKWRGLVMCLGAVLVLGLMQVGKMAAQQCGPEIKAKEATGKGRRAKEFIAAFNKGDAKALAGFWTLTGDYTDMAGHKYRGRAALEKLYKKVFATRKGAKLTIIVTSTRQLSPEVILQEGITEVTPADGSPSTAAGFSAVLVNKDGEWYFESVRDSLVQVPSNAKHFEDIEWLIGEWTGEEKGESARASYAWAENRNFMVSSFATTLNGLPVVGGTQWIAWDAVDKKIRSWSFYSGGGFGHAVWFKDGDTWTLTTTAKSAKGQKISATNLVTMVDNDHMTWQLTKLTVDGKAIPDPKPVKMKRAKPKE
jgi:uncharacterized protein (TIGR02246 family)